MAQLNPVLVYTVQRIAVFIAVTGIFWLLGLTGLPLLMVSVVISGLVALVLLRQTRGQISERLVQRRQSDQGRRGWLGRMSGRFDEGASSEDEDNR